MTIEKLVIASQNPHKIQEMQDLLRPLGIDVLSTKDFPDLKEVEEDRDTLSGNALKKAQYVSSETGLPALSDDTGLEVKALSGAPGIYSARYAGENSSYEENVQKLLKEMKKQTDRTARFRTVVALVTADSEYTFEGICNGHILLEQKGDKGFGYDPVFMPEGYERSFAELDSSEKNSISHRGKAIKNFVEFLKK